MGVPRGRVSTVTEQDRLVHRRQWEEAGIPYGHCLCGCGGRTGIARTTCREKGWIGGEHKRFLKGHGGQVARGPLPEEPNPSGLCWCGCGFPAPLAEKTHRGSGTVAGKPLRYIQGHQPPKAKTVLGEGPNPSGLCWCKCGGKTPLATRSVAGRGLVGGRPVRYIPGHENRTPTVADYEVDPESGCHIWLRGKTTGGYGTLRAGGDGSRTYAHRFYFEQAKGPIPEGFHIHHECETPACVNPDHLTALAQDEHLRLHKAAA